MPITYGNVPWPPKECDHAARYYTEWGAWYAGDVDGLSAFYRAGHVGVAQQRFYGSDSGKGRPIQYAGGFLGRLARFWWGKPPVPGQVTTRLHIPAASDVSMLSADLLFGEPPAFTIPDVQTAASDTASGSPAISPAVDKAQKRLETILDDGGAYSRFSEAAELCSAYGGVYLRVSANVTVASVPLLDALIPDVAIPEWANDRLQAVTFWRELDVEGTEYVGRGQVLRHLERHEVIPGGTPTGVVFHALYCGESDRLGTQVSLLEHAETARFAALVDENGMIVTGAHRLDVVYVPNMRPHRMLRGTPLGRSDYAGVEGAMDGLDETWSSWMRDVRIGKGRLIVPNLYLKSAGAGQGASFDAEQEVFQGLNMMLSESNAGEMTKIQFEIRVQQHADTAAAHWRTILRACGLSADAFGEEVKGGGGGTTAKEVIKRGERTVSTRAKKLGYWTPQLREILLAAMEIDLYVFRSGIAPVRPEVEWPDAAAIDPEAMARTLQMLDAAHAVSTHTKVAMLHGDWTGEQIDEEVALIDDAGGSAVEDPGTFTGIPPTPPTGAPAETPPVPAMPGAGPPEAA